MKELDSPSRRTSSSAYLLYKTRISATLDSSLHDFTPLSYNMSSPISQKLSSQANKAFGENATPAMPDAPKQDVERRASDASESGSFYDGRRRSSAAQRFANLEALKRRQDEESLARRQSFHDAYGKPGILGTWWNNFTRGPVVPQSQPKNGSS